MWYIEEYHVSIVSGKEKVQVLKIDALSGLSLVNQLLV
jgi:hypothetical protein